MRPSPTVVHQRNELAVLRQAIRCLLAGIWSQAFTPEHRPLGDAYAMQQWLQRSLTPLAPASPTVRDLVRLLNPEGSPRSWSDPKWLRRELRRLRRQAAMLGRQDRRQGA